MNRQPQFAPSPLEHPPKALGILLVSLEKDLDDGETKLCDGYQCVFGWDGVEGSGG